MTKLAERAMLASVTVRVWTGHKKAKSEADQIIAQNGAVKGSLRATKSLFPSAKSHDKIIKAAGAVRTYVYEHTLPWAEGVRILRSEGYMRFMDGMRKVTYKFDNAVEDFLQEYHYLVQDAQSDLSGLFNAADYPTVEDLRKKFAVITRFLPVPDADDWRVEMGDAAAEDLRRSVEAQVKASQAAAMQEVYDRIYEVAKNAYERLNDPDAIFRDSLVDNAVKLCKVLPALNLSNDPKVTQLSNKLMSSIGKTAPATLRKDPTVRKNTAAAMKDVMDKMSAMYPNGGLK